jgi:hypothetical protein
MFKRMARENFTMFGRLFEILLLVEKQLGRQARKYMYSLKNALIKKF